MEEVEVEVDVELAVEAVEVEGEEELVVGRRPKSVYSRTKAVGDKRESAALPSPCSSLSRAERSPLPAEGRF